MIPAGAIGNQLAMTITSERWYSSALEILLEDTHTDPRFGMGTIPPTVQHREPPLASLFVPDPSFTQAEGGKFGRGPGRGVKASRRRQRKIEQRPHWKAQLANSES